MLFIFRLCIVCTTWKGDASKGAFLKTSCSYCEAFWSITLLLYQLSRLSSERGMVVNICCSQALLPGDEIPERRRVRSVACRETLRYVHMNCDSYCILTFVPCIFIICVMNQQMRNWLTFYYTALYYTVPTCFGAVVWPILHSHTYVT